METIGQQKQEEVKLEEQEPEEVKSVISIIKRCKIWRGKTWKPNDIRRKKEKDLNQMKKR